MDKRTFAGHAVMPALFTWALVWCVVLAWPTHRTRTSETAGEKRVTVISFVIFVVIIATIIALGIWGKVPHLN